jgi:S1-C subfamily serine protease
MRKSTSLVLVAFALAVNAARGSAADWPRLVERYAPAIVNLKISIKTESGSGGQPEESTQEAQGALVDPSGLILVWNSHFSAGRFLDLLTQMDVGDYHVKVTPTAIRVYLGGEPTEHKAFLAAADSDLDLAFVQLEDAPPAPLPAIDFSRGAHVRMGEEVAAVSRLSSSFDRVPYFDVVRVAGEIRKPRRAWIVSGGNATQLGLPYFAGDGRPAGVLVTVMSRAKSDALSNPSNLMSDLLSLGRGEVEVGPLGLFLLPADRVQPVIEQARQRAAQLLAERRAASDEGD